MCQIDTEEGAVRGKGGHGESTIAYEITFSDLDHATKLCNTLPLQKKSVQRASFRIGAGNYRCMQEISGKRVQSDVHASSVCGALDLVEEVAVSGAVNVLSGNTEVLDQMLDLLLVAHRCVDLRADHAANVDGCCTNTPTCRVDQNTLSEPSASALDLMG